MAFNTKGCLWMSLGAAPDPDRDYQGWEWAGSEQEQLLASRVSKQTALGASDSDSEGFYLLFFSYVCFCRRSQLVNTPDFRFPVSTSSMMDSNSEHYGGALVQRRPQKGRMAALRDEPSKVSFQSLLFVLVPYSQKVLECFMWLVLCLFSLLCLIQSNIWSSFFSVCFCLPSLWTSATCKSVFK